MKRSGLALLSVLLISGLCSCGSDSGSVEIGVCLATSSNTLNTKIGEAIQNTFSDKRVDIQSADNNVASQKSQINGFINMGAKMIVVTPVQIESITTELKAARDAGIKVVVSGANKEGYDQYYDAVTISDEFLLGSNIALLAKHWAEKALAGQDYDVVVCYNEDNDDGRKRSSGMKMIQEPYLKNYDGDYINEAGAVVDDSHKITNPCYLPQASLEGHFHYHTQSVNISSGLDYMAEITNNFPKAKVILCYMSGFSAQMSTYLKNTYPSNYKDYGIFAGGVQGSEPNYILGSLESGVGKSFQYMGETKTGAESVFRGAVSFGGSDAAKSLASLSKKVYEGKEDTDYQKVNAEALGVWFTSKAQDDIPDTLAVKQLDVPFNSPVTDFDPLTCVKNPSENDTTILWQNK